MKRDGKLSGMLHVLLHMAGMEAAVTSERLAQMMGTNPVVIRRVMAGLRAQGLVQSEKGHGGGWRLGRPLAEVTLAEVYRAVGEPELFAMGNRSENPQCLVEQAVNAAIDNALSEAETLLMQRFGEVTLAMLAADFQNRADARGYVLLKDHPQKENDHDL
ncbi:Rrf2 family transcriptional regulator [Asticcacaulis sp. AND118]|uniref:Rrf2 family transcriptional regulator n=1 Tax=Asticcacaulis sp. AND118 TaxID=2840468 RepID=UPI001D000474|nr:Rrf2 family transcriptional regulator [Asticcacaulis sp. AND118]UDF03704.1 Rrf2 family transcriptional regulator [Asticcacaulis sp. AND118]